MKNYRVIHKENLFENIEHFSSTKICAMVKANAYGHGTKTMVELLNDKVEYFGVSSVDEGVYVRKFTDKPILICSKVFDLKKCKRNNLEFMVEDETDLINCLKHDLKDNCHLKINCGMNRFGVGSQINLKMLDVLLKENDVKLKSIYTHFPCTDLKRKTKKHFDHFCQLRKEITQETTICFGGSGVIDYKFPYDMIRVGIGLYGYGLEGLKPVEEIISHVIKTFYAKKGEYVGYGKFYRILEDGFFAIVPVGYGDGLRRDLSGFLQVEINGKKYCAVGRICMDAFFVRVDETVNVGDEVVVMKNAQVLAEKIDAIPYEILTGFSNFRGETIVKQ